MPSRPLKPCAHASCVRYAIPGESRCEQHKIKPKTGWGVRGGDGPPLPPWSQWRHIRTAVFRRDDYLCQVCKAQGIMRPGNEVDHIKPRSQGGTEDMKNLQTICRQCHAAKTQNESREGKRHGKDAT